MRSSAEVDVSVCNDSRCHRSNAATADRCSVVSALTGRRDGDLVGATERLPFTLIYIGVAKHAQ